MKKTMVTNKMQTYLTQPKFHKITIGHNIIRMEEKTKIPMKKVWTLYEINLNK